MIPSHATTPTITSAALIFTPPYCHREGFLAGALAAKDATNTAVSRSRSEVPQMDTPRALVDQSEGTHGLM